MRARHVFSGLLLVVLLRISAGGAERRFEVNGLVLDVDRAHGTVTISHDSIPGFMDAMVMPFRVRKARELDHVQPATLVTFTLVVTGASSYVSDIRVRPYDSVEKDPDQARRLKALDLALKSRRSGVPELQIGQTVPDFELIDQNHRSVRLSDFQGKVVAMTFIYTRCPLPDYCVRLTNNFGRLQSRFRNRLGKDLILLSITFDPEHDRPEVLANYAKVWKADSAAWHFLTGSLPSVKEVCDRFGMNFWPDEGLFTHSLHTVVIDRQRKLAANLEGNQFTAGQLGDLVEAWLAKSAR